tara:strand:- start:64 stop:1083 length:1020 start_codon:yes stop_codon:yes gene_type:complete
MKILITGCSGFICGYLIEKLLEKNHKIIGVDNHSKYGESIKNYENHPNYEFVKGDAKDVNLLKDLIKDCDQVVAAAAKIGGISYFHKYAYDLISENERIIASTFDASIYGFKFHNLEKINVISSSMVYENTKVYPTPEGNQLNSPPPSSTYGFQKLSTEYFAKGAWEQYKMPYTIIRPFNCVGIGEKKALGNHQIKSGNINLAMSHAIPDLVQKTLKGQKPLRIFGDGNQVRHFTYGGDLAEGISLCIENEKSLNEDFNLSIKTPTTILEASNLIWKKINKDESFEYISEQQYPYDVQKRSPNIDKAKKILGFEAKTTLDESLNEIIPWIKDQIKLGEI